MPPVTVSRDPRPRTDRRFRRPLAAGLLISVALHLAAALAWRGPALEPERRRGAPRAEGRPAAPPDRTLRAVALEEPDRERIPPRPRPVPVATAPEVGPTAAASELHRVTLEEPAVGSRSDGADAGAGRAAVRPPVPRSVLPEWDAPDAVRGSSVTVRVHVDSTGRPTGAVELRPRTPSRDFDRRLIRKVRRLRFSPARDARGRPLAAWAELTFTF